MRGVHRLRRSPARCLTRKDIVQRTFMTLMVAAWAALASAHDYQVGKIFIAHPWSRPTAPGMPMGVAYFTVENRGSAEDVLIGASTPAAARVEFHQTTLSEGMARMRPLAQVSLPPGKSVKLEPGGIHLMLVELKHPLEAGTQVPLTLVFRDAGQVEVLLHVEARDHTNLENGMTRALPQLANRGVLFAVGIADAT